MVVDGLDEFGADELGAVLEPGAGVATEVDAFEGFDAEVGGGAEEELLEGGEAVAALAEDGRGGEAERGGERVAAFDAEELFGLLVVDVEGDEVVGQGGIVNAVHGEAPLAVEDELAAKGVVELGLALGQPGPERLVLGVGAVGEDGAEK